MKRFQTVTQMTEAGYKRGGRYLIEHYKGFVIRSVMDDRAFDGNDLIPVIRADLDRDEYFCLDSERERAVNEIHKRCFARATEVWFEQEFNRQGKYGCYDHAYSGEAFAKGVLAAKQMIDQYRELYPALSAKEIAETVDRAKNWAYEMALEYAAKNRKQAGRV